MVKRGQGAFEYILLLAGVLLIVVLAIIILRGAIPGSQIGLAQCKAQVASVPVCISLTTGLWDPQACGATGCTYAVTGVSPTCETAFAGTPWDDGDGGTAPAGSLGNTADLTDEVTAFDCGLNPTK